MERQQVLERCGGRTEHGDGAHRGEDEGDRVPGSRAPEEQADCIGRDRQQIHAQRQWNERELVLCRASIVHRCSPCRSVVKRYSLLATRGPRGGAETWCRPSPTLVTESGPD